LASLESGDTGLWDQLKAAAIKIAAVTGIMRFIETSIRPGRIVSVANLACQARQESKTLGTIVASQNFSPHPATMDTSVVGSSRDNF
jgi:hypothetical protein